MALLVTLALLTLAALVRLALIPRSNLWADEIFSLATATGHSLEHPSSVAEPARGDFVEPDTPLLASEWRRYLEHGAPSSNLRGVVRAVMLSDTSPPLYYVLLHGWTRLLGTGDFAVRAFSVAWAVACFPWLISLARWTGGGRAVFGACAFFAVAPMSVYYGIEARMYTLLWFCTLVLMTVTLLLHRRGGSLVRSAAWIGAAAAGLLTHYFFVFPLAAAAAFLLFAPGRLSRRLLPGLLVLAALLVTPWYVHVPQQLGNWRITQGWLEAEPYRFTRLTAMREFVLHFFSGESFYLWKLHKKANAVVFGLFGLIALVGLLCLRRRLVEPPRLLLWLWFGFGCGGPILLDLMQGTYMSAVPRYASTALPAAYLLAATGLGCFGGRARLAVVALIVAGWMPTLASIFRKSGRSGPDVRALAQTIRADATPRDVVMIHSIPSGVLTFARYFDGATPLASWVELLGSRHVPGSLEALAGGREQVHFFRFHDLGAAAPEEEWLRAHAVVAKETQVNGTSITHFRPRAGPNF